MMRNILLITAYVFRLWQHITHTREFWIKLWGPIAVGAYVWLIPSYTTFELIYVILLAITLVVLYTFSRLTGPDLYVQSISYVQLMINLTAIGFCVSFLYVLGVLPTITSVSELSVVFISSIGILTFTSSSTTNWIDPISIFKSMNGTQLHQPGQYCSIQSTVPDKMLIILALCYYHVPVQSIYNRVYTSYAHFMLVSTNQNIAYCISFANKDQYLKYFLESSERNRSLHTDDSSDCNIASYIPVTNENLRYKFADTVGVNIISYESYSCVNSNLSIEHLCRSCQAKIMDASVESELVNPSDIMSQKI